MRQINAFFLVAIVCLPAPASAQSSSSAGDAVQVRVEIERLRAEVAELRAALAELRATVSSSSSPTSTAAEPGPEPADLAAQVAVLQAQSAEYAQTKVESMSKLPVRVFGTIVSSTVYNDAEVNWIDSPNLAQAPPAGSEEGSFTSTLRQSRVGLEVNGIAIGSSWRAGGVIAFDFYGGFPSASTGQVMGLPRLLYAFTRFSDERSSLLVGQDEMVFAPRNPTSIAAPSSPLLVRSGNLYLRVPQVTYARAFATGAESRLTLTGGLLAPVGGDNSTTTYVFPMPALSGERSRMPAFQARAAWSIGTEPTQERTEIGLSAHVGRERIGSTLNDSVAVAIDGNLRLWRFGLAGEAFSGENLDQFGGGVGQPARSRGGFVEARFDPTDRIRLAGGVGTDRVRGDDRVLFTLQRNTTGFGSLTYRFSPELSAAFEYRHLKTERRSAMPRSNGHYNGTLAYSF